MTSRQRQAPRTIARWCFQTLYVLQGNEQQPHLACGGDARAASAAPVPPFMPAPMPRPSSRAVARFGARWPSATDLRRHKQARLKHVICPRNQGAMLGPQGHADTGCDGSHSSRAGIGHAPPCRASPSMTIACLSMRGEYVRCSENAIHGGTWPLRALLLYLPTQPVSACPCGPSMAPPSMTIACLSMRGEYVRCSENAANEVTEKSSLNNRPS
jgi:hypothetical protein